MTSADYILSGAPLDKATAEERVGRSKAVSLVDRNHSWTWLWFTSGPGVGVSRRIRVCELTAASGSDSAPGM